MRSRVWRRLQSILGMAVLAGPASAVTIDWVTVGDPGNPADTSSNCFATNCGSVAEAYRISKYEVTNAQYTEFLNEKAKDDPLELYSMNMGDSVFGGITRANSSGSFTYSVKTGFENKPVNYVTFYGSLRFTNWLNNGQGSADTGTGAYTLLGGTATPSNGLTGTRNRGANIFLPSENEWYKAAHWDPGRQSFLDFPANSNTQTVCAAPGATPNTANCDAAAGNVTDVGAYTGSASPNGRFDQSGNVWEWSEEIVGGVNRGIRGAGLLEHPIYLSAWYRASFNPASFVGPDFGFRVASLVPEPGTGLLLMTGLAGLAARQERRKRTL